MLAELSKWNAGTGIPLNQWIGCMGNFRLAVGYSTVFWPCFEKFEDYIFLENRAGDLEHLRQWERKLAGDKSAIERVVNHVHIRDIQHSGCEDITGERVIYLGRILREIYEAKLRWQFPDDRFKVAFYEPPDRNDLTDYQLTFWKER